MKERRERKKRNLGPSVPTNVTDEQQEWHTATSEDEEAYVNELEQLYKD